VTLIRPLLSVPPLGELINEGGQGSVYRLQGDTSLVFKQYHEGIEPDRRGFQALVNWPHSLIPHDRAIIEQRTAWPRNFIQPVNAKIQGCLMPLIPQRFFVADGPTTFELHAQILHVDLVTGTPFPQPTPLQRYQLVLSFLEVVEVLHRNTMIIGDISAKNILWCIKGSQSQPEIYLIDCDSFRVMGERPPVPQSDTPHWVPPPHFREIRSDDMTGERTKSDDLYKVGLFVIRTLLARNADRDINNALNDGRTLQNLLDVIANSGISVTKGRARHIADLFRRSQEFPMDCPEAHEWIDALTATRIFTRVQ
jgi:hypothetical protein